MLEWILNTPLTCDSQEKIPTEVNFLFIVRPNLYDGNKDIRPGNSLFLRKLTLQ